MVSLLQQKKNYNLIFPKRWWIPKEKGRPGLTKERAAYWDSWKRDSYGRIAVKNAVIAAGRRSYKTEISKRQLVLSLPVQTGFDDPRYFHGAPTEGQAVRVAWNDLKKLTPAHWIKSISESNHCITTWWGSE